MVPITRSLSPNVTARWAHPCSDQHSACGALLMQIATLLVTDYTANLGECVGPSGLWVRVGRASPFQALQRRGGRWQGGGANSQQLPSRGF